MIVERQRLLAVTRILGVIQVENQALRRTGKAGNELFDEGLADTVDVLAACRVLKARDCRPRSQRGGIIERQAGCAKLEHRVVAQAVRVVTVLVAATNLVDALRQNIVIRMVDVTLMASVRQGRSEALGQTNLQVDAAQQHGAQIGRQTAASEIGTNTVSGNGGETELLWSRIYAGQGVFVLMRVF